MHVHTFGNTKKKKKKPSVIVMDHELTLSSKNSQGARALWTEKKGTSKLSVNLIQGDM